MQQQAKKATAIQAEKQKKNRAEKGIRLMLSNFIGSMKFDKSVSIQNVDTHFS
jgi:hypothetical protein